MYGLQWSTIYPVLGFDLVIFYLVTFTICIVINLFLPYKADKFTYHNIPLSKYNTKVLLSLYIFYLVDIIYSGYIPLIAFSSGDRDYGGSIEYGIPVLHVLVVTFNLFYALYAFHQFISNRNKRILLIYFLLLLPFVILLQRSNIMYIIIGSFFVYILSLKKISLKKLGYTFIAAVFSMYMFGYLGNLRSANGDSTYIPMSSGVTDDFLKGPIPNEFYWSYLYIGSPLANLQNNLNQARDKYTDYTALVVYEYMPDFLSKRLSKELSLQPRAFEQINSFLNVGTIYSRPYNYAGWTGIIITFIYFISLMNIYYTNICYSYTYSVTGFAMMFLAIALANFENTIQFSAYSFQLIYPLILSAIKKYKQSKSVMPIQQHESSFR